MRFIDFRKAFDFILKQCDCVFILSRLAPDCQLCLSQYRIPNRARCTGISTHHATLFYDEWTRHFELLNYSEFGTEVDGIRYVNKIELRDLPPNKVRFATLLHVIVLFNGFLHVEAHTTFLSHKPRSLMQANPSTVIIFTGFVIAVKCVFCLICTLDSVTEDNALLFLYS